VEIQLATALLVIGGWIGCMVGAYPMEQYGRRYTLLVNNSFFIVGAGLTAIGNLPCLMIGRFISGLGVGVTTVVPPVLLSEISSSATRGTVTTTHQVCAFLMFSSFIGSYSLYFDDFSFS
jgi:MFS family permease